MADTIKSSQVGIIVLEDGSEVNEFKIPEVTASEFNRANIDAFINACATINGGNIFINKEGNWLTVNSTTHQADYIEEKTMTYLDLT